MKKYLFWFPLVPQTMTAANPDILVLDDNQGGGQKNKAISLSMSKKSKKRIRNGNDDSEDDEDQNSDAKTTTKRKKPPLKRKKQASEKKPPFCHPLPTSRPPNEFSVPTGGRCIRSVGFDIGACRLGIAVIEGVEFRLSSCCRVLYAEVVDLETDGKSEPLLAQQLHKMIGTRANILFHPSIDAYVVEKQAASFGAKSGNYRMMTIAGIITAILQSQTKYNKNYHERRKKANKIGMPIIHCQAASLKNCYSPPDSWDLQDKSQSQAWKKWNEDKKAEQALQTEATSETQARRKKQSRLSRSEIFDNFVSDTMLPITSNQTGDDEMDFEAAAVQRKKKAAIARVNKNHDQNKIFNKYAIMRYVRHQSDKEFQEYFENRLQMVDKKDPQKDVSDACLNAMSVLQIGLEKFKKNAAKCKKDNLRPKESRLYVGSPDSGTRFAFVKHTAFAERNTNIEEIG